MARLDTGRRRSARRQVLYEAYAKALDRPPCDRRSVWRRDRAPVSNLCVQLHDGIDDRSYCLSGRMTASKRAAGIGRRCIAMRPLRGIPAPTISIATDRLSDQLLGLPFHLSLRPEDIDSDLPTPSSKHRAMKLGIMQPYAFAYLGYFQLINAVDLFVLYDDVAFEKQGWINRNVLVHAHGPQRFHAARAQAAARTADLRDAAARVEGQSAQAR